MLIKRVWGQKGLCALLAKERVDVNLRSHVSIKRALVVKSHPALVAGKFVVVLFRLQVPAQGLLVDKVSVAFGAVELAGRVF